jgi:hypothetical protein
MNGNCWNMTVQMREDAVSSHWFCKPWKVFDENTGRYGKIAHRKCSVYLGPKLSLLDWWNTMQHCCTRKQSMLPELHVSISFSFKYAYSMDFCLCNMWAERTQLF